LIDYLAIARALLRNPKILLLDEGKSVEYKSELPDLSIFSKF
jgi:ABC-type molybdenum transport system ATPase subunit/photorepair protein PhrA